MSEYEREKQRQNDEKMALYHAAWEYQDTLYERYKLAGRERVLAHLAPRLLVNERDKLGKLMRRAGLMFPPITDE